MSARDVNAMNVSELDNASQMQCQKLERLKMEAVAAEDYELAASLKKQIAALKTGEQIESSPLLLESSIGMKNMNKKSSADYWTFFGKLGIHESMLQDQARTRAYREAILGNAEAFAGKVVLDVGAGSGILTFFALQAGAAKVRHACVV